MKSKIGNIFVSDKILEEYCVQTYKIDPYFYDHHKELIKGDKNGRNYMLFKIDVYILEHNLAVEINEKAHTDRDLILEEKRQEALEKELIVSLLELIQVKKVMMQIMKLVEYRHLLVNLKTDN